MAAFKKRSGTTDRGKDYENFMVAKCILELVTDDNIKDFKISSNDDSFGTFDDVILEIERHNNNIENYALQLKHVNKTKNLPLASLTANKGDFSIQKYFKSFQDEKESIMGYKLILFTNLKFEVKADTVIIVIDENTEQTEYKSDKKFEVKIAESNASNVVNTSETSNICYKFQIVDSSCASSEYQNFFENFFLYTNQADVDNLEKTVQKKFQSMFCCNDLISNKYVQIINKWSIREGTKEKLDKATIQKTIAICLLYSSIYPFSFGTVSENARILQRAAAKFTITVCSRRSSEKISNIWGDAKEKLKNVDIKEINRIGRIYEPNWEYVNNLNNLSSENCTKLLWFMDKNCPLIVNENHLLDKAIQLCKDRKYVLIQENASNLSLENCSVFQKLSDLKNYFDIFEDVTTNFKCKLPGNDVNLDYLIREYEEFQDIITTDELLEMVDESYVFKDQQVPLPVPYIRRNLSLNAINVRYFENVDKNTFNVVSNVPKEESSRRKYFNKKNFYVKENECSWKEFEEICRKNQAKSATHFRFNKGTCQLVGSIGNVSNLEPYCIENYLREDEAAFYTPRYQNNLNIITDDSGMGKSTLLKSIKNNLSHNLWTILLSPTDISKICQFALKEKDRDKIIDCILNLKYPNYNNFHKLILKLLMQKGKVACLWDGLDEISDENLKVVTDLIFDFSQEISLQWITSRRHLRKFLQNKFNVFPATIAPFDKEEQERYIMERFRSTENLKDGITDIITRNIAFASNTDILGIPQQIFMLTELFLRGQEKYVNLINDKLFLLTDLYHHFMEDKYLFFYKEKVGMDILHSDAAKSEYESLKKERIKNYQKAALMSLFSKKCLSKLNCECSEFIKKIQEEGDPIGFITVVNYEKPQFVHKSYAEYLSALYLTENYTTIPELKSIIFRSEYTNIRYFFDCLLAKDSVLHVAVLHKNIETLKQNEDQIMNCKDAGGRNLLQLAISWGNRYNQYETKHERKRRYNIFFDDSRSQIEDIPTSDKEILEYLVQKCDATKIDQIFKMDSLSYAEECECLVNILVVLPHYQNLDYFNSKSVHFTSNILFFAVYLGYDGAMKYFENVKIKDIRTLRNNTLFHTACKNGHLEIVKMLINSKMKGKKNKIIAKFMKTTPLYRTQIQIDVVNSSKETPLHLASYNGHYEIAKLLIKSNANVDVVSKNGNTPLHWASWNGHYKIAELLIKSNANVDVVDEGGETPLHLSSWSGHYEIAELLIKSNANVDVVDEEGTTPLHLASRNGHYEFAELLIKSNANVGAGDVFGQTPLHLASWSGHYEIAELLIKSNANVDVVDEEGNTPLHWASRKGHYEIAELLIKSNANVDVADKDGKTPLHVASRYGQYDIVELLRKSHTNTDVADENGKTSLSVGLGKNKI